MHPPGVCGSPEFQGFLSPMGSVLPDSHQHEFRQQVSDFYKFPSTSVWTTCAPSLMQLSPVGVVTMMPSSGLSILSSCSSSASSFVGVMSWSPMPGVSQCALDTCEFDSSTVTPGLPVWFARSQSCTGECNISEVAPCAHPWID